MDLYLERSETSTHLSLCVQYLDSTSPESPHAFTLTESKAYVHISTYIHMGSVFYCDTNCIQLYW